MNKQLFTDISGASIATVAPVQPSGSERFASVDAMVLATQPDFPVFAYRPDHARNAARFFVSNFPGTPMYAVKTNPEPQMLNALWDGGIRHFDVASLSEIAIVQETLPDAKLFFMHPVKPRHAIEAAYHRHNVRAYSLDCMAELEKMREVLGEDANDLELFIRLSIPNEHAALRLSGKFGASVEDAAELLRAARPWAKRLGLCFHVGSQCMDPADYHTALVLAREVIENSGVMVDALDVGGGFPSKYPGMNPPPLSRYMAQIKRSLKHLHLDKMEVLCEPGRALVAEAGSLILRVELRKGNALYLNDGVYGGLFDAGFAGFNFPVRAIRKGGEMNPMLEEFRLYGPTCDSMDTMEGPFHLPADIGEGDWIEFGQLGSYSAALRTGFNGFTRCDLALVDDLPLMSLYGKPRQTFQLAA